MAKRSAQTNGKGNGEVTVLVGRGAREPGWAAPLERIASRLRQGGERVGVVVPLVSCNQRHPDFIIS